MAVGIYREGEKKRKKEPRVGHAPLRSVSRDVIWAYRLCTSSEEISSLTRFTSMHITVFGTKSCSRECVA